MSDANLTDEGPNPFVTNIEDDTLANGNYRTTRWTGTNIQMTLMNIEPGHDIGLEVHPDGGTGLPGAAVAWARARAGSSLSIGRVEIVGSRRSLIGSPVLLNNIERRNCVHQRVRAMDRCTAFDNRRL